MQPAYSSCPSDSITDQIIEFLTEFAEGTRYYNIDFFVGGKSKGIGDPIKTGVLRLEPRFSRCLRSKPRANVFRHRLNR
jgi:hypothetical protein